MAIELDMIKWKELYPYVKQFRQLDLDQTGRLSEENVRQAMQSTDAQRGFVSSAQTGVQFMVEPRMLAPVAAPAGIAAASSSSLAAPSSAAV